MSSGAQLLRLVAVLCLGVVGICCGKATYSIDAQHTDDDAASGCQAISIAEVTVGVHHSCARHTDGSAQCWGGNFQAQLGDGRSLHQTCFDFSENIDCSTRPVTVANLSRVIRIDAGDFDHTCAVDAAGDVWCWGYNSEGQVGAPAGTREFSPIRVEISDVADVRGGVEQTCALTNAGEVWCWGSNLVGQLGTGVPGPGTFVPARVTSSVAGLAVGGVHGCALSDDGQVDCWGGNELQQVGMPEPSGVPTPAHVTGLPLVQKLALGTAHSCALSVSGAVWCWGANEDGQLGRGARTTSGLPEVVPDLNDVSDLWAGGDGTCAKRASGGIWCWGNNFVGQLATGTDGEIISVPQQIAALDHAIEVDLAFQHGCARFDDGVTKCWGRGDFGVLGGGSEIWSKLPVDVCF